MCIDALVSTTNSRSFAFFEVVSAGIPFSSPGTFKKKHSFVRILGLTNIFAKSHAALRAHLCWCKVSSCDLSYAHEAHTFGYFLAVDFSQFEFGAKCP